MWPPMLLSGWIGDIIQEIYLFFSLSILNIYSELYKEKQAMSQGMYLLSLKHLAADSFKIVDEHLYKSAITIHWLFSIKNYILILHLYYPISSVYKWFRSVLYRLDLYNNSCKCYRIKKIDLEDKKLCSYFQIVSVLTRSLTTDMVTSCCRYISSLI